MQILTLKANNAYGLPAESYVADSINFAESVARGEAVLDCPLHLRPFISTEDWNGRRILFTRGGGIGDILFCTPTLREIKKRWPACIITFACFKHYMGVLEHNPDVDHIMSHPMLVSDFGKFDAYLYLEEMHDGNADTHKTHAVDLILNMTGLDTEDKELRYEIEFQERSAAWARFPKGNRPRIGVQLMASIPSRTWPRGHVTEFTKLAIKEGFEVIWFSLPGATGTGKTPPPEHLIPIDRCDPPLSLRESAALMSTCDGFVGPDSGLTHIAGALGIPTVATYASFPSKLRTSYAKSIKAIDGEPMRPARGLQPCNPCFHHNRPGQNIWPDGPCASSGFCNVLASITPELVLRKLTRHLRKFSLRNGGR